MLCSTIKRLSVQRVFAHFFFFIIKPLLGFGIDFRFGLGLMLWLQLWLDFGLGKGLGLG